MLLAEEDPVYLQGQTCDFCKAKEVATVSPIALSDWFEMVRDLYVPDPDGDTLVERFRKDWRLFDNPRMEDANVRHLLAEIFDDGEVVRKRYRPYNDAKWRNPREWEQLRDELMHENRWFLTSEIGLDRLEGHLNSLLIPKPEFFRITSHWYRSRIIRGDKRYSVDEMGAPPPNLSTHGRANPAGISYLYLSSQSETSIAEVRPHPGEQISVAEFSVLAGRVLDLREPRKRVSPFLLENREDLEELLAVLPLLERLGEELSKPVLPASAAYEYTPCLLYTSDAADE